MTIIDWAGVVSAVFFLSVYIDGKTEPEPIGHETLVSETECAPV